MSASERLIGLIPAAGVGQRFGQAHPKQYSLLNGTPLLLWAVRALKAHKAVDAVYVIVAATDLTAHPLLSQQPGVHVLAVGGASRHETVLNGLNHLKNESLAADNDWILVHDAARPGLPLACLKRLIDTARIHPVGAILALPVADTLKQQVVHIPPPLPTSFHQTAGTPLVPPVIKTTWQRDGLWTAQTPQMFRLRPLLDALSIAKQRVATDVNIAAVTDEASAMEQAGYGAVLVMGDLANWKITYADDMDRVKRLMAIPAIPSVQYRIGQGYDVHRLVPGRALILGSITIEHPCGLLGHSDGDVLLHALTDALLGAAGLGDIGQHFPDTDVRYRGADSAILLTSCLEKVLEAGWQLVNIDSTVIAQTPRLGPHIQTMRQHLAVLTNLPVQAVNIKAKTNEKLGYLGREEAIEAQAVVMLVSKGL